MVGFEWICLDQNGVGWIYADLTVRIWVGFDVFGWIWGECGRFDWICLDLGGLELIGADSGIQAAHGELWRLFQNYPEWKITRND